MYGLGEKGEGGKLRTENGKVFGFFLHLAGLKRCEPVLSTGPTNTNLPDEGEKMEWQIRQTYKISNVPLFNLSCLQPRYTHSIRGKVFGT